MHPASDPSTGTCETGASAPVKGMGYPENTVLSLLAIVLVAAGAFYAVSWSLRDDRVRAYQWDFAAMAEGEGPWTFPETERGKGENGMTFVIDRTGPGPTLTMEFDAAAVRTIRTHIAITRVADGTPVPYVLEWYWSSPSQVADAAGKWPFSTDRGATFVQPDRHNVELRQVDIYQHHHWNGLIGKAFLGIKFTGAISGPFRVETKKIEFLE